MQISRLFEIVYLLLGRGQVTARELAERFEVSVRTIYRDVDALAQAGVPVYAMQGAGGGIRISDAYVLNKSALSDEEQSHILLALQSLGAVGHEASGALLSRLGSLFNKDSADWIEVDFSRWGNAPDDRNALAAVKEAILSRHALRFTYYSGYGERTERTVNPTKLLFKSRAWYVQAFCHDRQDYRTFKLVRMEKVTILPDTFDPLTLPERPPHETEGDGEGVPPPHVMPVMLRFQPQIAWRVLDEFNPGLIVRGEDGTMTVRMHVAYDGWLEGYLMSFGTSLEVLSPPILREKLADQLRKLLSIYEQT